MTIMLPNSTETTASFFGHEVIFTYFFRNTLTGGLVTSKFVTTMMTKFWPLDIKISSQN